VEGWRKETCEGRVGGKSEREEKQERGLVG